MPGSIFGLGIRLEADDRLSRGVRQAERAMGRASEGAKAMRRAVQSMGRQLGMTRRTLASAKRDIDAVSNSMSQLGSAQRNTGVAFAAAGAAVGAGLGLAVKEAADFEHIMAEVQQKSGLADGQIDDLGNRLSLLASKLPLADKELAKVAVVAAQLGVASRDGVEGVEALAFSAAKLANTSDLTEEAAAASIAKLSNLFNLDVTADADRLGSSLVMMANTTTANVSTIVEISRRFGGMANAAGIAASEVIALSAVMTDAGVNAEEAGSSLTKLVQKMAVPKNMAKFAEQLQVPIEEYTRMINEDALGTTLKFLDTFKGMKTTDVVKTLSELQLARVGTTKTVLGLSNMSERLQETIANSRQAFAGGTELDRAFEAMLKTLTSKMKTLMGSIVTFARSVGVTLFPIIKPAVDAATMFVGALLRLPAPIKMVIGVMAALTTGALLFGGAVLIGSGALGLLTAGSLAYASAAGLQLTANTAVGISMQVLGHQFRAVWASMGAAITMGKAWVIQQMRNLSAGNAWIIQQFAAARASWFTVAALQAGVRWLGAQALALLRFVNIGMFQAIPMTWKFIFGLTHWNRATITAALSTTAFGRAILGAATTGYAALAPLLPVILAIGGAALVVWAAWKPLKSLFLGVWDGIVEGLRPVVDTFRFAFKEIGEAVGSALTAVASLFGATDGASSSIRTLGRTVAQGLLWWSGFNLAVRTVGLALRGVMSVVSGFIRATGDLAKSVFEPMVEVGAEFKRVFDGVNAGLQGTLTATSGAGDSYAALFGTIADGAAWAWKWLTPFGHAMTAAGLVMKMLAGAAKPIAEAFGEVGLALRDAWSQVSEALGALSSETGQAMQEPIDILEWIGAGARSVGRAIGWVVATFIRPMASTFRKVGDIVAGLTRTIGGLFTTTEEQSEQPGLSRSLSTWEKISLAVSAVGDTIRYFTRQWSSMVDAMKSSKLGQWAIDLGSAITSYILNPLGSLIDGLHWILGQMGMIEDQVAKEVRQLNENLAAVQVEATLAPQPAQQQQAMTREQQLAMARQAFYGGSVSPAPSAPGSVSPRSRLAAVGHSASGITIATPAMRMPPRPATQAVQFSPPPAPTQLPPVARSVPASAPRPIPSRSAPPAGDVHVHLSIDGDEVAHKVIKAIDQASIRAGRDPGMSFMGVG